MGVFDHKSLKGENCEYGSCQNKAWTYVKYRSMSNNTDEWSAKHFCHKHYCQKFIGNWPDHKEKLYEIDSFNSYMDYRNNQKPT